MLPKSDPNYVYCERHHIVPKSIGGLNTDDNLVNLLPKEHCVAHMLLVKIAMQENNKNTIIRLGKALIAFKYRKNSDQISIRDISSRLYEKLLQNGKPMLDETKIKISNAKLGKKWTAAQRKSKNLYYERCRELGIKIIPWNKGIPLAEETKQKMHHTIETNGNKNTGKKHSIEWNIHEVYSRLSNKFINVDFSKFDFLVYINIPKNVKFQKQAGNDLYGKYIRHEMLKAFILT